MNDELDVIRTAIILAIGRAKARTDRITLIAFLTDIKAAIEEYIQSLKDEGTKS